MDKSHGRISSNKSKAETYRGNKTKENEYVCELKRSMFKHHAIQQKKNTQTQTQQQSKEPLLSHSTCSASFPNLLG